MIPKRFDLAAKRFDLAALELYWDRIWIWWSERSLREQLLLGALSAMAIFAVLLVVIISPLRAERAEALAQIRNAALLEARLRAGGADLGRAGRILRGTPSAIVADSAAAANLAIERIEPSGSGIRVVLGEAAFDAVLTWISDVERSSRLRVSDVNIERTAAPGTVSATVLLS